MTSLKSVFKSTMLMLLTIMLTACSMALVGGLPLPSLAKPPKCNLLFSNGPLVPSDDAANNFEGYTRIYSVEDLQEMVWNGKYVLANDIDARATKDWDDGFIPIGGVFQGVFEGQGYVIRGLHIKKTSGENYTGLFETIGGPGIVRNVGFEDANVVGHRQTGILAGVSRGDVAGVYATGQVSGTGYVGGIIGQIGAGDVSFLQGACADVVVKGSGGHVGGLVGENRGTIRMAYSIGSASSNTAGGLGGLVGTNESSGSIEQSFSTGSVISSGTNNNVGGLVGNNKGSVYETYSRGQISVTGSATRQGGVVGQNDNGTVTSSYWDIVNSGQTGSAGGTGIYPEDFRSQTFWSNETDWEIDFAGHGSESWRLSDRDPAPVLNFDAFMNLVFGQ